jgi:hypothetical protein
MSRVIGLVAFAAALCACPAGSPAPNVGPVITNAAACAIDVIEDLAGPIDIAATIRDCGTTAAEIYALVSQLLANMPEASPTVATRTGVQVSRGDYVSHLQQWQAAAKNAGSK